MDDLRATLITLLVGLIGTVFSVALLELRRWLRARYQIDLTDEQVKALNRALDAGIAYANEQDRKAMKEGAKLEGPQKMVLASAHARDAGVTLGEPELRRAIEARMPASRVP